MKTDIILCGVGGQGILSIATIIGEAAMKEDLYIKQAEVHGMSQRGGDVQSNLRISSEPIASDLIPTGSADVIISMEPMEALRYLPFLSKEGWIITSSAPFVNIPNYPEIETIKADLLTGDMAQAQVRFKGADEENGFMRLELDFENGQWRVKNFDQPEAFGPGGYLKIMQDFAGEHGISYEGIASPKGDDSDQQ